MFWQKKWTKRVCKEVPREVGSTEENRGSVTTTNGKKLGREKKKFNGIICYTFWAMNRAVLRGHWEKRVGGAPGGSVSENARRTSYTKRLRTENSRRFLLFFNSGKAIFIITWPDSTVFLNHDPYLSFLLYKNPRESKLFQPFLEIVSGKNNALIWVEKEW